MTATLPPFPTDDQALDVLEHALAGSFSWDAIEDGPVLVGADFPLSAVLEFFSGYDPSKLAPTDQSDVFEYQGGPVYHPNDVIESLIAEVRRLRTLIAEGRS